MERIVLRKEKSDFPKVKITCSKDSSDVIRQFYHEDISIYESFFLLLLNRANNTIGYVKISQGGVAGTVVDVKLIKYSVECLASAVILAHNHPSGNLVPSKEDVKITKRVVSALELMDINVLDHVVMTEESYFSFADEGML
ncbi:MAG: JAB domain-containing protein [Bacteroidetes bacterium]|nr:JAB domain-containing protein [Bacteroidota bacterium]